MKISSVSEGEKKSPIGIVHKYKGAAPHATSTVQLESKRRVRVWKLKREKIFKRIKIFE